MNKKMAIEIDVRFVSTPSMPGSLWSDRFPLDPYKETHSKRTTERPNIWMLVIQFIKKVQEIYLYILLAVNYFIESELSGH